MLLDEIESTREFDIPKDPLECVIGQDTIVDKVKVAVKQRRNLLLVGPPGIGKSMIAQALAYHLPKPRSQISVKHNLGNPERPLVEVMSLTEVDSEKKRLLLSKGRIVSPVEVPHFIAERLGLRCSICGTTSNAQEGVCFRCGAVKRGKSVKGRSSVFSDLITDVLEVTPGCDEEVYATRIGAGGKEEVVLYRRLPDNHVRVLDQATLESLEKHRRGMQKNVIVSLNRNMFVHATGASETELLGDVRHDPYGSHPEIGTPAYMRVVAGAIHEAHEGVLFVDELPHLSHLQNYILTAMQEKKFPLTGRNPQSSGASVRVDDVPCDFVFVGACNISDVGGILPPLRSRIVGNGYELLLDTTMPDTLENRDRVLQFVAQEVCFDGRIPHATREAVNVLVDDSRRRAREIDGMRDSLSLRLRALGGVVRLAGDFAVLDESDFIDVSHVKRGIEEAKPIEHQLKDRYGSVWRGLGKDSSLAVEVGGADSSYA